MQARTTQGPTKSRLQIPQLGIAGMQQWVARNPDGKQLHQLGGGANDSSELLWSMSELAGVTDICNAALHPALVLTTEVCRLVGRL